MTQRSHAVATGLFLVVLGAGLLVAVFWLHGGTRSGRVYELVTRGSVSGLYVGAPVTEHGLTVGRVIALGLHGYPPEVVVHIRVRRAVRLGAGTRAVIATPLFGGGGSLDLLPPARGPFRPLSGHPPRLPLVASSASKIMTDLAATAGHLRTLSARLDRLLGPKTLRRLAVMVREGSRTGRHLDRLSAEASRSLPLLVTHVDRLIGSSRRLTHALRAEVASLHRSTRRLEAHLLLRTVPESDRALRSLDRAARTWSRFGALLDRNPQVILYGRRFTAPKRHRRARPRPGGSSP